MLDKLKEAISRIIDAIKAWIKKLLGKI